MKKYDIIIIGAGAAGLMLCRALANDTHFQNKDILLLDKNPKTANDRTWCFWEKGSGEFDAIIAHSWPEIVFKGSDFIRKFQLEPYNYKMIEGATFYREYLNDIRTFKNITILLEEVIDVINLESGVQVNTVLGQYVGNNVFTSVLKKETMLEQRRFPVLQQHFKGYFVQTRDAVFNPQQATFMDFSIPQNGKTRFMYVLPLTTKEALVEYTLFSHHLLEEEEYDAALNQYLREDLNLDDFTISRTEKGSIPMTLYDFTRENTTSLLHIGTAGGWTKPSTGFTFKNTQEKVGELVAYLKLNKRLDQFNRRRRHRWYDLLLLDILAEKNHLGQLIFESMFKKRTAQEIFKFLDEKSSLTEDLKIIWACPKKPFIRAFFRRMSGSSRH